MSKHILANNPDAAARRKQTPMVPAGLRPRFSAAPGQLRNNGVSRPFVRREEREDVVVKRADLPRSYGSQLAGWVGG